MATLTLFNAGTATFTNGSANLVGSGTSWTTLLAGDVIRAPDGRFYELNAVPVDDTHIVLDRVYAGTTASAAVGGVDWSILRASASRDSVRTATKQLTDVASTYRSVMKLTDADQLVKVNRATGADRAGIVMQTGGIDVFQTGIFESANYALRYLKAAVWTEAISVNSTTGAVSLNGPLSFTDTTEATGVGTTASMLIKGGLEVAKKLFVAGAVSLASTLAVAAGVSINGGGLVMTGASGNSGDFLRFSDGTNARSFYMTAGSNFLVLGGGVSPIYFPPSGDININSATASTTSASGALTVGGGVGIGGNLNVAGAMLATQGTKYPNSTGLLFAPSSGAYGGVFTTGLAMSGNIMALSNTAGDTYIQGGAGNAYYLALYGADGSVKINSTTASTTSTTGALTVAGGLGVAGSVNIGQGLIGNYAVFSANGSATSSMLQLIAQYPSMLWKGTTNATDEKLWDCYIPATNQLVFRAVNDAGTSATAALAFTRSGATVTQVSVPNTTVSSSSITGALVVGGGIGVGGNLIAGGAVIGSSVTAGTGGIGGTTGTLFLNGGSGTNGGPIIAFRKNNADLWYQGCYSAIAGGTSNDLAWYNGVAGGIPLRINATTNDVSLSAALNVAGTVAVSANVYCSALWTQYYASPSTQGIIYFDSTGSRYIYNNGSVFVVGGRALQIADTTASSSSTTGALIVGGGVGVGGALCAVGNILTNGTVSSTVAPTSQPQFSSALSPAIVSVATGTNAIITTDTSYNCIIIGESVVDGGSSIWLLTAGYATLVGGAPNWAVGGAAGKNSVQYDGSGAYRVYNNTGSTVSYRIMRLKFG